MKQDIYQHLDKVFDLRGRAAGSGVNVFVLIEMDDFRRMSASLGLETAELLVGAFHERVRGFLRTCDQHIVISDERCGVILSEIQNMEQLDLAAAKLFRQFEAPIEVIDRSFKVTLFAAFVVPTKARTGAAQLLDEGERGLFEARSTNNRYTVVKLDKKNVDVVDDWQAQQEVEGGFRARVVSFVLSTQGARSLPIDGRCRGVASLGISATGPDPSTVFYAPHRTQCDSQTSYLVLHSLGRRYLSQLAETCIGRGQRGTWCIGGQRNRTSIAGHTRFV